MPGNQVSHLAPAKPRFWKDLDLSRGVLGWVDGTAYELFSTSEHLEGSIEVSLISAEYIYVYAFKFLKSLRETRRSRLTSSRLSLRKTILALVAVQLFDCVGVRQDSFNCRPTLTWANHGLVGKRKRSRILPRLRRDRERWVRWSWRKRLRLLGRIILIF